MIKLSLIIVAYKNGKILKRELESIKKYNDLGDELEVIVVDNSPENEKLEKHIGLFDLPNYKYIKADNNGFGTSNNIGFKVSHGKIIGFINPDIIFIEEVFDRICQCFINDANLRLMGCKLLDDNGNDNYSFFVDIIDSIYKDIYMKLTHKFDFFYEKNMFTSGSNIFIRRDDFVEIGMFDEKIFMYYEELDIKNRILKAYGANTIKYNKNIKFKHLEGLNTNVFSEFNILVGLDSLMHMSSKYNLNYKRKIRYDYKKNRFKALIKSLINKSGNEKQIADTILKYCNDNEIRF